MYVARMHAAFARPVRSLASSFGAVSEGNTILTSRVCMAPKHNGSGVIIGMPKNFVKLHSEAVEMADVQWTKVGVESVV